MAENLNFPLLHCQIQNLKYSSDHLEQWKVRNTIDYTIKAS
jgi:hypothetical protein